MAKNPESKYVKAQPDPAIPAFEPHQLQELKQLSIQEPGIIGALSALENYYILRYLKAAEVLRVAEESIYPLAEDETANIIILQTALIPQDYRSPHLDFLAISPFSRAKKLQVELTYAHIPRLNSDSAEFTLGLKLYQQAGRDTFFAQQVSLYFKEAAFVRVHHSGHEHDFEVLTKLAQAINFFTSLTSVFDRRIMPHEEEADGKVVTFVKPRAPRVIRFNRKPKLRLVHSV